MINLALRFSYFGDRFSGSQMQPGLRTVEGEFIEACRRIQVFDDWREARFATAGRTDRGVHARRQVCSFLTDLPERAIQVLNRVLPGDIWCTGWAEPPEGFHPRYSARSRTYRYYFFPAPEKIAAMNDAAQVFIGRHDFSSFARSSGRDPERRILAARVFLEGRFAVFEVTAESFLWNMVRRMATVLEAVGSGESDAAEIERLLAEPTEQRVAAAPPWGLILWDIDYGMTFNPIQIDVKSGRYLASRLRYHAVMACAADRLAPDDRAV